MIKTVVQIVEIWIALTIVVFFWNSVLKILSFGVFDSFSSVFNYFAYLFWYEITLAFTVILSSLMVVMVGRWCMSWASNNWWQTPNNNWN